MEVRKRGEEVKHLSGVSGGGWRRREIAGRVHPNYEVNFSPWLEIDLGGGNLPTFVASMSGGLIRLFFFAMPIRRYRRSLGVQ